MPTAKLNLSTHLLLTFGLNLTLFCGLWCVALASTDVGGHRGLVIGVVASIMLAVVAMWSITRRVRAAFDSPIAATQRIVAGDLTLKIDTGAADGQGDVGELMLAIRNLNERMYHLVSEVRAGTTTVVSTSSQISRDNDSLRTRTENQVASLEQTAEAMADLNSTVQQNAEHARQADELVSSASLCANKGGTVMRQVVQTMGSIRDSSRKIVDIIALIDSIAFQTNILALNAAVEAARAGDHGRGFAVVASEVRVLAKRSASAAKEIKSLINESVTTVNTGGKLVDDAGKTMATIVSSVESMAGIIQNIGNASTRQLTGITSVNAKVTEVTRINSNNTRLINDVIKATNTLNSQAVALLKSLSGFNLGIREFGTGEEACAMVKRAVEFLKAHGKDALLADVKKLGAGQFVERDLYLMVLSVNDYTFIAHGLNPRVLHYDSRLSKDVDGKFYMKDLIETAKRSGEGWVEYKWNHPMTNEVKEKASYVQRVGDLAIVCGAYKS